MPRDALIAFTGSAWMGSLVRSGAAIAFPSLALLHDKQPALGILLYLVEIILTAVMLLARTSLSEVLVSRAARRGAARTQDVWDVRKARRLAAAIVAVGLMGAPFLWLAVLIAHPDMRWQTLRDTVLDRGEWIALIVLSSAVLDALVAPVRSAEWLQTSVAVQMNRTILLHPVIMFGYMIFAVSGTLAGMVAIFVGGRLLMDLNALRSGTRDRARKQWMHRGGRLN